jgi:hypothetical protein
MPEQNLDPAVGTAEHQQARAALGCCHVPSLPCRPKFSRAGAAGWDFMAE